MRILQAASELFPYSKSGGLADMVGALSKALAHKNHRVGVVTPMYRGMRDRFPSLAPFDWQMDLPLGAERVSAQVWTLNPTEHLTVYFIDVPEFYDRPGLYGEAGQDYPDNARRFVFFAKAVAHLGRYLPWQPELVHLHDWQTGLVPLLLKHQSLAQGWRTAPATVFTIHNLAYHGLFSPLDYGLTNLPWDYFNPDGLEFYGRLNCLKAGLAFADTLTTVSPRYAQEITTEAFGCGLDGILRRRQADLEGILNGVDYEDWNPETDPHLMHRYSADRMAGKVATKQALLRQLGLPAELDLPLFATITRLVEQKGVDIQLGALEEMLSAPLQFVLLGSGTPAFESAYRDLASRHPQRVAVRIGYDNALAHQIEAGADFFLMPSRYEPSGLNQMYSQRYGTIPLVRAVGGLDDSVRDIQEDEEGMTGIKFHEYSARALAKAMRKALVLYRTPGLLRRYRHNGMVTNFSWEQTCLEYARLYEEVLTPR